MPASFEVVPACQLPSAARISFPACYLDVAPPVSFQPIRRSRRDRPSAVPAGEAHPRRRVRALVMLSREERSAKRVVPAESKHPYPLLAVSSLGTRSAASPSPGSIKARFRRTFSCKSACLSCMEAPTSASRVAPPPGAAADRSSAKRAPRLPRSRASALPPRASGSRPTAAGLLPSSAAPERPLSPSPPPAKPRSMTATPVPHTVAPIARHIAPAAPDRIPPPPRREPKSAFRQIAFRLPKPTPGSVCVPLR